MTTSFLYFVRHGESKNNAIKIVLPPDEDVLTEHGKLQADLLGEHLRDVKFTKAFTSDYRRCVETTTHILSKSKHPEVVNLEISCDERIRERNVGKYEGGDFQNVMVYLAEQMFGEGIPALEVEFPGGDSASNMSSRAESFMKDIFKLVDDSKNGSESILVTTHGFAMLYLVNYLTQSIDQVKLSKATNIISKLAPNTGYIKLAIQKQSENGTKNARSIEVLTEHATPHLVPLKKEDAVGSYTRGTKFDGCLHQ